jgi:mono/diheme cytochrome c family protein
VASTSLGRLGTGLLGLAILVTSLVEDARLESVAQSPPPRESNETGKPKERSTGSNRAASEVTPATHSRRTALQVYRAACMVCHDGNGRGETARDTSKEIPDFTDPRWQASRSDSELSRSILQGKGMSMPRMQAKLGSLDVKEMVTFVRGFRGGKQVVEDEPTPPQPPPATVASPAFSNTAHQPTQPPSSSRWEASIREGSQLFRKSCVRCHDQDGNGLGMRESLPTIPDFSNRSWQKSRADAQLIVSVLDGKETTMPAFRGKLNRAQAADLVNYIRTFSPSPPESSPADPDEFEVQFRKLQAEFDDLEKQLRALRAKRP